MTPNPQRPSDEDLLAGIGEQPLTEVSEDDYKRLTGESLSETVDLQRWKRGMDALRDYDRLEAEVIAGESASAEVRAEIRKRIFPALRNMEGAPKDAGVWALTEADITQTSQDVLMNGLVEGCDANVHVFNTMAVQVIQIAVVAASYNAQEESWAHRIFKRDIRIDPGSNMVEETLNLLKRRSPDDTTGQKPKAVTDMMRRGVMTFMERQVLADALKAPWRLGHGNPLPYELLTGAGNPKFIELSLPILRRLIEHRKFIFVPSDTTEQHIKTIGDALEPLEYAIIQDAESYLKRIAGGHFRGEWAAVLEKNLKGFMADVGPQVLIGAYRASRFAPAQVFYAHRDFIHEAARIVIADSVLLDHRGFPMLIEMADNMCRTYFGAQTIERPAFAAFANTESPFRHLNERATRR